MIRLLNKLGRGLVLVGLVVLPFAACEKDDTNLEKGKSSRNANNQPQKHNVELVYGPNPDKHWQNISMDTLYKYNADKNVDTIFMVLDYANQFSTFSTNQLNFIRTKLRERHNVNPNKVFGKGEMQLWNKSVVDHPEIVRFFADTLKYNVTYYNALKSR